MKVDDFDIFFELNDIPELKNRHDYEFYTRAEQSAIIKRFRSRFDPEGSKYTNGRLLLIAGSRKYPGAALLAASAGQHCGVGFTEIAAPGCLSEIIPARCPEALRILLGSKAVGSLKYKHLSVLLDASKRADSVVIGPGLGRDFETIEAVIAFLLHTQTTKIVVDADALFAISALLKKDHGPEFVRRIFRDKDAVITPHIGEAAYLLGENYKDIEKKRLETAERLCILTSANVLLKGRHTITYRPGGSYTVNGTGNPALSKGGSGDVLSGIIGALMARGRNAYDAARFGAYIHGLAADKLAAKYGMSGVLPGDLYVEFRKFL